MPNAEPTMFNSEEEANQPDPSSQTVPTNENPSSVGELVGEGKKFSDVESLAKGKLESDKHVENLENQIKENADEQIS